MSLPPSWTAVLDAIAQSLSETLARAAVREQAPPGELPAVTIPSVERLDAVLASFGQGVERVSAAAAVADAALTAAAESLGDWQQRARRLAEGGPGAVS